MSDPSFVAVGDVMVDVSVSGTGHAASIDVRAGGSAVNAALWAAAYGADAGVVGRIGDDLGGRAVRAALEERDVRPDLSVDSDAPTGTFLVVDGEIHADRGANARFEPAHLPPELRADVVLVSGYLPSVTVAAAVDRAVAEWIALAPGFLDPLPIGADAVLVDESEARRLTGEGPEDAVRSLGRSFRLACVTRGAAGAVAMLEGTLARSISEPVEAACRAGAGDAFAACLLVGLARGDDLGEALDAASRAGATAVAGVAP